MTMLNVDEEVIDMNPLDGTHHKRGAAKAETRGRKCTVIAMHRHRPTNFLGLNRLPIIDRDNFSNMWLASP